MIAHHEIIRTNSYSVTDFHFAVMIVCWEDGKSVCLTIHTIRNLNGWLVVNIGTYFFSNACNFKTIIYIFCKKSVCVRNKLIAKRFDIERGILSKIGITVVSI